MQKLKLDLDTLAVESYATQAVDAAEGTVAAHSTPVTIATITIPVTIEATEWLTWIC